MQKPKNYEIIGMRLDYDVVEQIRIASSQFDLQLLQDLAPNDAKETACYIHLGFVPATDELRSIIKQGADWVVEYFKKGDVREVKGGWYHPLFHGMLLCLLIDDDSKLRSICSWATPRKRPEYKGPLPDEIQLMYLVLASFFQENPSKGFERLRTKIAACRTREVRLLSKALTAMAERDEGEFARAIQKCVEHHKRKPKPDPDAFFMEDWLPLHANVVYLVGLKLGLERPEYPDQIQAYLMTPESVGFGR